MSDRRFVSHRFVSRRLVAVVLACCGQAVGQQNIGQVSPTSLYLQTGTIDTAQGVAVAGLADLVGANAAGRRFVIQLDGPMTPTRRAALLDAGVALGDYLPMYAYVVTLDRADAGKVAALGFIRWHTEYKSEWKFSPEAGARQYAGDAITSLVEGGRVPLIVTLFDDAGADSADAALAGLGARTYWKTDIAGNTTISIDIAAANAGALAGIATVQFVEPAPELNYRNDTNHWIVQSNVPGQTPIWDAGIRGLGQVIGVIDGAVDENHCSFNDSVPPGPTHRKIVAYNWGSPGADFHGTHVAGTAAGDAGQSNATRGVAYQAKLCSAPIPAFNQTAVSNALTLHHTQGARVHTNSWGDDGTTAYNSMCRGFDDFQYVNEDSFVCLAVTNTSTLKNPENAKNLLAVGATQDTPSQGSHCTGGTGPTSDGRRKPEIYAPGCSTQSSQAGTSCGTTGATGTSMASPAIAGTAALVRQYYTDGYYPTGIADPGNAFTPSSALIKATLLNSTVDMTGVSGFPSNQEGWGRVLADNALHFPGDTRTTVVTDVPNANGLSTAAVIDESLEVLGSGEALRVTLVWTEPAAAAGASFASINDLDLEVISPAGQTYRGNVFSGGVSTTGGAKDDRNNVEMVHLPNPQPGVWTVRVIGAGVNQGLQGYSLVSSGNLEQSAAGLSVFLTSPVPSLIEPGAPTEVMVTVKPGEDIVVPGSEKISYRFGNDPFTTVALTHVGGDQYMATIPAADCNDDPEFYVEAEGVAGGVKTSPPGAPTNLFSMVVGELQTKTTYTQSFESGLPAGWSATGLWNITSSCAPAAPCDGTLFAYYGQTSTCTFNNGGTNEGELTAAVINLPAVPPGGKVELSYCYNLETEANSSFDLHEVRINGTTVDTPGEANTWNTRTVDVTSFAGQPVKLSFFFDTVDGVLNEFRGWQIDNIVITSTGLVCEPASCYADCDLSGSLDFFDFLCFQNEFAAATAYADCDGSGSHDFFDFLCFQNAFAAGCP